MEKYGVLIVAFVIALIGFIFSIAAWVLAAIGLEYLTNWSWWVIVPVIFFCSLFNIFMNAFWRSFKDAV